MVKCIRNPLAIVALVGLSTGLALGPLPDCWLIASAQVPDPISDLLQTPEQAKPEQPNSADAVADDGAGGNETTISRPVSARGRPDFRMRATLYHTGAGGVGTRDASGCRVVAMRTAAVDRRTIPLRSIIFVPETVGLRMPDGSAHDGYWYASDTGGAIRGHRIDFFTGMNSSSMRPMMRINTTTVTVSRIGRFQGCPASSGPGAGERGAPVAETSTVIPAKPTPTNSE